MEEPKLTVEEIARGCFGPVVNPYHHTISQGSGNSALTHMRIHRELKPDEFASETKIVKRADWDEPIGNEPRSRPKNPPRYHLAYEKNRI